MFFCFCVTGGRKVRLSALLGLKKTISWRSTHRLGAPPLVAAVASRLRRCFVFCSAIRWGGRSYWHDAPRRLAAQKVSRGLGEVSGPHADCAWASQPLRGDSARPPPFPHTSSLAHDCIFIEVHRAEGLSHDLGWVDTAVALAGSL